MDNKENQKPKKKKLTGIDVLHYPIVFQEIEWRIQSTTRGDDTKTIIVPYITNRCVQNRFDSAFGFDGWTCEFRETTNGFICRISLLKEFNRLFKEDGASKTKIEPDKGGISDSMKRCAVQFGLGRGLYDYPRIAIKGEHKYIPYQVMPMLSKLVKEINKGVKQKDFITLTV